MHNNLVVITGNAHTKLGDSIAKNLNLDLLKIEATKFSDGEIQIKLLENIRGTDAFIVQPTMPPAENIIELLLMIDAVKRASCRRVTAVIPYFGYARQDRKDQPRVPITSKLVANLLVAAGVDRVLTMDLHAGQIQGFFDIPVDHLYAAPVLINHLRNKDLKENLVVVSPDVGGVKMARAYSEALGAELAIVAKHRVSATEVEAMNVIGEVDGCNVLLVDDITETAGTLTAAAKILKEKGAKSIFAGVSHAVLGEMGNRRLDESEIEELICTNSTPYTEGKKVTSLSVAPLLGEGIRRIHHDESVTSLFDIV